jgi:hypothetical protein
MALEKIRERASYHFNLADKQTRSAARWATLFRWGIPILSAFITAAVSGELMLYDFNLKDYVVWFALLLTLMTVANSVARPSDHFRNGAIYANRFWAFITALDIGIEEIDNQNVDAETKKRLASAYIAKKNNELANLIDEFNSTFLPAQSPEGSKPKV